MHVYTLLEVAGKKLRCVIQRLQCRDLCDLFLLFEKVQVDATEAAMVFRPKAEHRGIDPDAFAARYRERIDQYGKRLEAEFSEHVPCDVPHFGNVVQRRGYPSSPKNWIAVSVSKKGQNRACGTIQSPKKRPHKVSNDPCKNTSYLFVLVNIFTFYA